MTSTKDKITTFFSPWWAVVWFVASIVWAVWLNILYIQGGATNDWLGFISIVPIWSFVAYVMVRSARRRKRAAEPNDEITPG
tara:strand:+ start:2527 stop:2772 length:246 start_codon:yes stop_codon:yes gene_type:complete